MTRHHRLLAAALSLCGLAFHGLPNASAQTLYVTANRTLGNGNPITGFTGSVVVGADAANAAFPNVVADITGTITSFINARNQSTVNISAGTIGQVGSAGQTFTSVQIGQGSTVNLSGGTLNGLVSVGPFFGNDGTVNTFNMSGGTVPYIYNNGGGVVNITGGTVVATAGSPRGVVTNYGNGTINVTGGTIDILNGTDFVGSGTINFGGTASVTSMNVNGGTTNISGGTLGASGVFVRQTGIANFTGSGLTVNQTGSGAFFDDIYYQNLIISDYTVTGTLTNGAAVNTTVSAGTNFSNNGSLATFNAPDLAPDLYVSMDQTVTGVYNSINVGVDEDFNPFNPTATIADGTDAVYLTSYSNSVTNMTGGIVRGGVYVAEQSTFNMSGGEAPGGIYSDFGATINISGGYTSYLGVNCSTTISGGVIDYVETSNGATLIVQGSGLSATGTAERGWDPISQTNYLSAGYFQVTGTLTDGNAFDQTVLASGASGDANQQTLAGPQAAPNLFLTANTTTDAFYNQVFVGLDATFTVNSSPTVNFGTGTDVGNVFVYNQSTLNVQDGVVNGTIYAGGNTDLNISGGTLASVYHSGTGTGKVTVSGGSINYIAPQKLITITGGDLATLDTYAGARVRIEGGNIATMLLYGATSAVTDVLITGGNVGTINFQTAGNLVTILGGSVGEVLGGGGGAVNIYGGTIGANTLLNYRTTSTQFNLYGNNLLLSDATTGTYTDNFGNTVNGVWWNLTGTLQSGSALSTRYFERNGSLSGPANLTLGAAAPEPGALALLLPIVGLVAGLHRYRATSVRRAS